MPLRTLPLLLALIAGPVAALESPGTARTASPQALQAARALVKPDTDWHGFLMFAFGDEYYRDLRVRAPSLEACRAQMVPVLEELTRKIDFGFCGNVRTGIVEEYERER